MVGHAHVFLKMATKRNLDEEDAHLQTLMNSSNESHVLAEQAKKLIIEYRAEAEQLRNKLSRERDDRHKTESASLELLEKVRNKYEQTIEQLRLSIKDQMEINIDLKDQLEHVRQHQNRSDKSEPMDVGCSTDDDELELLRLKLNEADMSLMRKDNELSNIRLDMKLLERESHRAQDQVKFLRELNRELKEKLNSSQEANRAQELKEQEQAEQLKSLQQKVDEKDRTVTNKIHEFEVCCQYLLSLLAVCFSKDCG